MDTDLNVLVGHSLPTYEEAIDQLLMSHFAGYVVAIKWRRTGSEQMIADIAHRLDAVADSRPGQRLGWDVALVVLDPDNRKRARIAKAKQRQLDLYHIMLQEAERALRISYLDDGAEHDVE